jgi:tripartite ATP-independent transporter DctM subunit
MTESLVGFGVMLLLAFARVPIAFAMAFVGFAGFAMLTSLDAGLAMVGQVTYENGITYELVVLPLFILMGNLVTRSGFSEALYRAAYAFLGHLRGGLAMATVVACGGFSAVCGSSLATAATMVKVAMPSMRHYRYADGLAAGSIAAGGTLGILIPPSVILVIYGVITETNIGKLFIAGILPGFVAVVFFIFAIGMVTSLHPEVGPSGERSGWRERMLAMADVWGVVLLFLLVMGGIYGGAFTATEAAGIGAGGALVLALLRGSLGLCGLYDVLRESLITTSMMFAVVFGAMIFANFINLAGLPTALAGWIRGMELPPTMVLVAIAGMYLMLGCVLDTLAMVLLTVPAIFPVVEALGFDPIWFGVFVVVMAEIGMLTPPVGLNVFVIKATMPDVNSGTVFKGVVPFWAAHLTLAMLLIFFPTLALFLPSLMNL